MARATIRLSDTELRRTAAKALSLLERNAAPISSGDKHPTSPIIEKRLREWIKVVADGDPELFDRRLALEGLDYEQARLLLAEVSPDIDIPQWAGVLNDLLHAAALCDEAVPANRGERAFINASDPVPFEDLLAPFVVAARQRLDEACAGRFERLASKARIACERALLLNLSDMAARVLLVEFRAFTAANQFLISGGNGGLSSDDEAEQDGRRNYRRFVGDFGATGWAGIFRDYPVLARILANTFLHWVESTASFCAVWIRTLAKSAAFFFPRGTLAKSSRFNRACPIRTTAAAPSSS